MTVRPDTILRRRYFDIDPAKRVRYRTDEEYAEHFASIFTEAVRCRLRNIDGIAAELSGGLDSSMVVGAIERLGRPDPHFDTFSLKFDDPQADERGFIQDVAQMWGLQTIWCEPFFAKFPDLTSEIRRYQYLGARPNTSMDALMHRAMRERGYRVVVTGQGGDEWFTGSPDCFADLLCEFRFGDLYRLIRDEAMYPTRVRPGHSRLGLLLRRTLWPLVPAEPKFLINRLRGIKLMPPFVNQDFLQKFDLERARNAPTREILGLSYSQRSMYQVFNLGMAILYSELNERECAFAGLEGRHPLLDRRVIEYAFAIPEDQRCRPRAIKYVMRQAGSGVLPESVRNRRTKAEFFCMLLSGLKVMTAGLGGESAFESFELARRGWIEPDALRNFYRQRIDDPTANLWPLWSVMELEIWARECLVGSLS
jgi:asparagine synthase (glutamine-hydrolysing)